MGLLGCNLRVRSWLDFEHEQLEPSSPWSSIVSSYNFSLFVNIQYYDCRYMVNLYTVFVVCSVHTVLHGYRLGIAEGQSFALDSCCRFEAGTCNGIF